MQVGIINVDTEWHCSPSKRSPLSLFPCFLCVSDGNVIKCQKKKKKKILKINIYTVWHHIRFWWQISCIAVCHKSLYFEFYPSWLHSFNFTWTYLVWMHSGCYQLLSLCFLYETNTATPGRERQRPFRTQFIRLWEGRSSLWEWQNAALTTYKSAPGWILQYGVSVCSYTNGRNLGCTNPLR